MSVEEAIKQEALRIPAVSTASILLETSLGALVIDLFGADCPALTAHFTNLVRCKFWHGCTACELIPDIAVFFAHRDDTAYEAALTAQLQRSTGRDSGDSFYALLDRTSEGKDEQTGRRNIDSKAGAESVAAIAEEGRLACKRCCTTIDVPRTLLTDTNNNTQTPSNGSARRVFQRVTGAGPGAVSSPALLHRAGLLIVDHTTVNSYNSGTTASCRMKFGLTLSNRNMDFLAARYVAIGQVREGWPLLLRRLRTLPCRDVPVTTTPSQGHTSNNTNNTNTDSGTMSIVLPETPRWPRPIRLLRIKHCTVLPTPGTECYRDINASSSSNHNTGIGCVMPYDVRDSLPDVSTLGTSSSRQRAHEQQQQQIKAKLGTILHSAGCFRFWASAQDVARANATLRALLAHCQPPMLVLVPTTHAHTKAHREENDDDKKNDDDEEVRSIEYNAHYSGCYLSSDEELGSVSATSRDDKQQPQQAASQQSSEKARKALREAAQQLHEEKANETLALMLNVLNRVADVKGDIAPPENVLFVCKLNPVTTGEGLAMCFAQFGEVVSAEVIMDHKTGQSLCYGFVEFASVEACYRAFQKMDKALIDDSRIHVDFSQSVSKLWAQRQREMRKRPRNTRVMQKKEEHDSTPASDDASLPQQTTNAATAITTVEHVMSSWRFVDPATRSCNARAALRTETLRRMELYLLHILHSLCSHKPPSRQNSQNNKPHSASKPVSTRVLRSLRETLLVLQLLHENVCHNALSTQRDIYYHLVREACQASRVAEIIQQLAQTLRLPRQALGVTAGMRGAVGGTLRFHGQLLTASSSSSSSSTALSEGIAMPVCEEELRVRSMGATPCMSHSCCCTSSVQPSDDTCDEAFVVEPQTRFILVIEKHTVFYKLMQERLYSLVPCVMLTAQGFPTHAARVLLHNLHAACPDIPLVGLVDYNPSGLAILMQYKLGNAQLQERVCYAVPALRWLGLRTAHMMPTSEVHGNAVWGAIPCLLPRQACTARDQAVLRNLLTRLEHAAHDDEEKGEKEEDEVVGAAEPTSSSPGHNTPAAAGGERCTSVQQQHQKTAKKLGCNVCVVSAMRAEDKASLARWHTEAKAMQHYDIKVEIEAMSTQAQWGTCQASTSSHSANSEHGMCEGRFAEWVGQRLLKHDYI